jgi:hypothetical protein
MSWWQFWCVWKCVPQWRLCWEYKQYNRRNTRQNNIVIFTLTEINDILGALCRMGIIHFFTKTNWYFANLITCYQRKFTRSYIMLISPATRIYSSVVLVFFEWRWEVGQHRRLWTTNTWLGNSKASSKRVGKWIYCYNSKLGNHSGGHSFR